MPPAGLSPRSEPGDMRRPIARPVGSTTRPYSAGFRVHCPDRSVPTPVTDSGDDRPISGHGNGFAKLHAHDGVVDARKGARYDHDHDRYHEMLMVSNTQIRAPDQIRRLERRAARICLSSIGRLLSCVGGCDAHQLPTLRGNDPVRLCAGYRGRLMPRW